MIKETLDAIVYVAAPISVGLAAGVFAFQWYGYRMVSKEYEKEFRINKERVRQKAKFCLEEIDKMNGLRQQLYLGPKLAFKRFLERT